MSSTDAQDDAGGVGKLTTIKAVSPTWRHALTVLEATVDGRRKAIALGSERVFGGVFFVDSLQSDFVAAEVAPKDLQRATRNCLHF